jgi:hypothetical protein
MGFRGPRWRRSVCGSFAGQEPLRTGTAQYSKSSTVGRSLMGWRRGMGMVENGGEGEVG